MSNRVLALIERLSRQYVVSDALDLTDSFVFPLALYFGGEIVLLKRPEDAVGVVFATVAESRKLGGRTVTYEILEVPDDLTVRFPVIVDWNYLTDTGKIVATNRIRYFMNIVDGAPRIEIIEYLKVGFPNMPKLLKDLQKPH